MACAFSGNTLFSSGDRGRFVSQFSAIAAPTPPHLLRLDAERATLYFDLIMHSSSAAMTLRVCTFAVVLMLAACSGNEPRPSKRAIGDEVTHELAGTRWALMALGDKAVTVSDGGREAYIVLNSVASSVVGHAGCNRVSSTYEVHDARLSFGEVIATRMFCQDMPTETALLAAMQATAGWRISGSQLELLDANQQTLARFAARDLR